MVDTSGLLGGGLYGFSARLFLLFLQNLLSLLDRLASLPLLWLLDLANISQKANTLGLSTARSLLSGHAYQHLASRLLFDGYNAVLLAPIVRVQLLPDVPPLGVHVEVAAELYSLRLTL